MERNLERMLELLVETHVRATFFWLGWVADKHKRLVRNCHTAGHEIASHGHEHVLAYKVGPKVFQKDIDQAKKTLEDITGTDVAGFRAPGFGITDKDKWAFEVIREVGYEYDSSVFPSVRGHGGMRESLLGPHVIATQAGLLREIPVSVIELLGRRFSLFGGGYLRLAPKWLIRWGVKKLREAGRPLIVYVHPREIDLEQPRLPLGPVRRFKCYVNLKTTMPKLEWLCTSFEFCTMQELANRCLR